MLVCNCMTTSCGGMEIYKYIKVYDLGSVVKRKPVIEVGAKEGPLKEMQEPEPSSRITARCKRK